MNRSTLDALAGFEQRLSDVLKDVERARLDFEARLAAALAAEERIEREHDEEHADKLAGGSPGRSPLGPIAERPPPANCPPLLVAVAAGGVRGSDGDRPSREGNPVLRRRCQVGDAPQRGRRRALTTLMAAAGKGDAGIKIKADAAIQAIELFGWGVFAAASAFLMAHYAYLYFDLVEELISLRRYPTAGEFSRRLDCSASAGFSLADLCCHSSSAYRGPLALSCNDS